MDDQKYEPEVKEAAPEPMEEPIRASELLGDAAYASSQESQASKTSSLVNQGTLPQLDLVNTGEHARNGSGGPKSESGLPQSSDGKGKDEPFPVGLGEGKPASGFYEHVPQSKTGIENKPETNNNDKPEPFQVGLGEGKPASGFYEHVPQSKSGSEKAPNPYQLPGLELNQGDTKDGGFSKTGDLSKTDVIQTFSAQGGNQDNSKPAGVIQGISDNIKSNIWGSNQGLDGGFAKAVGTVAITAATLGTFQLGELQHSQAWQNLPERNAVICPKKDANGNMAVTPEQWAKCAADVNTRTDDTGRKFGNCAEKAATACYDIMEQIRKNPAMAGCSVRQCWQEGGSHSWAEVKMPNGEIHIVDPWRGVSGKQEDLKKDYPNYSNNNPSKVSTTWYNAENSPAPAPAQAAPARPQPADHERLLRGRRNDSLTGR